MYKSEIRSLTGIRGVAAIYVMFYHYFESIQSTKLPKSHLETFINHGYLCVDLFFILSSVLMCITAKKFTQKLTPNDYLIFMKKRFARIYPLYFVILMFSFLILKCNNTAGLITSLFLVSTIFYKKGQILQPLWSLSAEWIMYLIFPFLLYGISRIPRKLSIISLPLISFLFLYFIALKLKSLGYYTVLNIVSINGLTRCFADYLLGIAIFLVPSRARHVISGTAAQILTVGLVIASLCLIYTDILVIFFFGLLILLLLEDNGLISKLLGLNILYTLGLLSYSIYLIHYLFIYTPYMKYASHEAIGILYRLASSLFTIILSFFSYRFIELPAGKYLRKKLIC